jgi:hypothetical protein
MMPRDAHEGLLVSRDLLVSTEVSRQKPAALALASIAIAIGMPVGRLLEPVALYHAASPSI